MKKGRPQYCGGGENSALKLVKCDLMLCRCSLTNDIYLLRGGAVLKLSGDELTILAE